MQAVRRGWRTHPKLLLLPSHHAAFHECRAPGAQGRASRVEFRASALGRSTHYTLGYSYGDAPLTIQWKLVDGDIMRTLDGDYMFEPVNNGTLVTYDLSIDLVIPLPGFVKRRAENRILHTLNELKARCES